MMHESSGPASRRPLYTFLALVAAFAAIGYTVALIMGDENRTGGIVLVQFAPLVAAFISKLVFQRNLRGLGWGWGKTRYQVVAYGLAFFLPLIRALKLDSSPALKSAVQTVLKPPRSEVNTSCEPSGLKRGCMS